VYRASRQIHCSTCRSLSERYLTRSQPSRNNNEPRPFHLRHTRGLTNVGRKTRYRVVVMCVCVCVHCGLKDTKYYMCARYVWLSETSGGRGNLLKPNKTIEERKKNRYGIESHVVSHRGTRSTLAIARIRRYMHTHTRVRSSMYSQQIMHNAILKCMNIILCVSIDAHANDRVYIYIHTYMGIPQWRTKDGLEQNVFVPK